MSNETQDLWEFAHGLERDIDALKRHVDKNLDPRLNALESRFNAEIDVWRRRRDDTPRP